MLFISQFLLLCFFAHGKRQENRLRAGSSNSSKALDALGVYEFKRFENQEATYHTLVHCCASYVRQACIGCVHEYDDDEDTVTTAMGRQSDLVN